MLALMPAIATIVSILLLEQIPTALEVAGIGLVIAGVTLHRSSPERGLG